MKDDTEHKNKCKVLILVVENHDLWKRIIEIEYEKEIDRDIFNSEQRHLVKLFDERTLNTYQNFRLVYIYYRSMLAQQKLDLL